MAAYAAVVSLKHTINGLLNSTRVASSREILEFAYNEATSLQQVLQGLNDRSRSRSSIVRMEGEIRDCANKLEDILEFHELKSQDEEVIGKEISSFGKTTKRMEKEYIQELSKDDDDDDGDGNGDDDFPSDHISDYGEEMVGHSAGFAYIRNHLLRSMRPDDICVFSSLGRPGTGRTMLAKAIFDDAREGRHPQVFDFWAWVTVGSHYQLHQVLMGILSQVVVIKNNLDEDDELLIDDINKCLYTALENRRYIIVLDGVDDVDLVNYLKSILPDSGNGSLIFVTTSTKEVAESTQMSLLLELPRAYFEETMWLATRQLLFGHYSIPGEMEVAGKKIIRNCGSRFISIAKTLLFLTSSEVTVEQWSKIADDEENPIFMVAGEIAEVSRIKFELQNYKEEFVKTVLDLLDISNYVEMMRMSMYPERFFSKMQAISMVGMAGIGKSTFAKNIFEDKSVFAHFDHQVWINLGINYKTEGVLIDILASIYPEIHKLRMKTDEKLVRDLCMQVSKKRCLIVLDDLCSQTPLHHLKGVFPDIKGTILVTSRLVKVARLGKDDIGFEIELLDEEESWRLLRQKVFPGGSCPPEFEKAGQQIAKKCDGLPLLILTVAEQLLKVDISQEYLENVASGAEKSVFKNAHYQISKTLLPSYHGLPQYLKPFFLYIGVFLENFEIPINELINLSISEGFLESNFPQMEEDFFAECLSELVDRSLVMVEHKAFGFQIKRCRLHAVFWHLSNNQAMENKLFHAMNNYGDCSVESVESQHRLCIRNSVLLGIKDVQKSLVSNISAHSLLCVGPFHQYPVPLNFDFRLMRVMNAVTIRLYEFPDEFVSLLHLKYLSLTCNGNLPALVSNLCMLQCLIVQRYMNIKSSLNSRPLPVEIWNMKELKHLQIMGGCLPNFESGNGLLKLLTLLDVSAQSCRKEVLRWIPNLNRLGIRIELAPVDEGDSFRCLNEINHLGRLESLKCVVVNPHIGSKIAPPPAPVSMFSQSLKKLSLNGLRFPWKHMSIIGKLGNLEVLKLKCYAFQGIIWEMDSRSPFKKLKFLLIEDTDLVNWKIVSMVAMGLERLCIKHCYKLQELPISLRLDLLKKIEIVDCSTSTATWAEQMGMLTSCQVSIRRSWFAKTRQE